MNRRIALIFLVVLATTAFGQSVNPRLRQLEDCLQRQGFGVTVSQTTRDGINIRCCWSIGVDARGQEITNQLVYRVPDSIVARRRQQVAIALDSIRTAFADLSKTSTETHMYENHTTCADTIEYVWGYKPSGSLRPRNYNNRVSFLNAREEVSFSYHKNCDDWDVGSYFHVYQKPDGLLPEDKKDFDIAAFEAHIQPAFAVLKSLQGAATYPVYWRHDKEYKDSLAGGRIFMILGSDDVNHAGLVTGTHYFIPAQYKAETNALFRQLDSLAYDYVDSHPEYTYDYSGNPTLPYATSPTGQLFLDPATSMVTFRVQGYGRTIGSDTYFLRCYMMDDGLHILSITNKGEGWMPMEWQKLKSWVNGKKEYLERVGQ